MIEIATWSDVVDVTSCHSQIRLHVFVCPLIFLFDDPWLEFENKMRVSENQDRKNKKAHHKLGQRGFKIPPEKVLIFFHRKPLRWTISHQENHQRAVRLGLWFLGSGFVYWYRWGAWSFLIHYPRGNGTGGRKCYSCVVFSSLIVASTPPMGEGEMEEKGRPLFKQNCAHWQRGTCCITQTP